MKELMMNVIRFTEEDIITASSWTFQNFGDGDKSNNKFAGIKAASASSNNISKLNDVISKGLEVANAGVTANSIFYDVDGVTSLGKINTLFGSANKDDTAGANLNGVYFTFSITDKNFHRCQ